MDKQFEFLMYQSADEDVFVNALIKDESVWLNQKAMAELFGCSTDNISLHLKNIFAEGELDKAAVAEKISETAADGKKYLTQFYNLDAIISVGYRVNSRRATKFRIWATGILKEYMIKGFAMDDERLKQGKPPLEKTIFVNYWKEFVLSVQANAVFGSRLFTMEEFDSSVNEFLAFLKYDVLEGKGKISKSFVFITVRVYY